ncbi:hypothetical protein E9934_00225 [Nocardioides caeni]|uniref:Uncharacterized protein n=1 Tax=Nocardioides caeni TaxID=574700 RepID=A0A4S8NNF5_9ACTN|nr:hypothetical protein [Nocardioides caeni]THV18125.1 hypothetical protein E9934_00225 [Nocardioides caeni]
MSTATPVPPVPPVPPAPVGPPTLDLGKSGRTPFGRLVTVEWRKMVDTRSGIWLLAITGGLLALVAGLVVLVVGLNDGFFSRCRSSSPSSASSSSPASGVSATR